MFAVVNNKRLPSSAQNSLTVAASLSSSLPSAAAGRIYLTYYCICEAMHRRWIRTDKRHIYEWRLNARNNNSYNSTDVCMLKSPLNIYYTRRLAISSEMRRADFSLCSFIPRFIPFELSFLLL